jgi:hypothetical protein
MVVATSQLIKSFTAFMLEVALKISLVSSLKVCVSNRFDILCHILDSPSDICLIPDHKIILFVLQNGSICFFSPELSKLTSTFVCFDGSADSYKATFGGFGQFLSLCILATYSSHCEAKFIKFPPFDQFAHSSTQFLAGIRILKYTEQLNICNVVGDKFGFAFVSAQATFLYSFSLVSETQE